MCVIHARHRLRSAVRGEFQFRAAARGGQRLCHSRVAQRLAAGAEDEVAPPGCSSSGLESTSKMSTV